MPVANVGSRWEDGNLIFYSKIDGQEILIFDAEEGKLVLPDGSGIEADGDAFIVTEPDGETIEVKNDKLQTKGADGDVTLNEGEDDEVTLTITNGLITKIEGGE